MSTPVQAAPGHAPRIGIEPAAVVAYVLIALAVAVGLVLRWYHLGAQSLWFDEGYTQWLISQPPTRILAVLRNDVGAPLHYVLWHYYATAFGDSEFALRSLSALLSSAAIGVFYLLARRILHRITSLAVAMTLFCLSVMQVQYAQEARYYALLSLLSLLSLYSLHVFLHTRSRIAQAGLVLSAAASLYTHNVMAVYLLALDAAWLILPAPVGLGRRLKDLLLTSALISVVYLPWMPVLLAQMHWAQGRFWASPPGLAETGWALAGLLGTRVFVVKHVLSGWMIGANAVAVAVIVVSALMLVLPCLLPRRLSASGARNLAGILIYAALPVALVWVQSHLAQPIFMERIFIASSCALPLALAMAFEHTTATLRPAALVLLCLLVLSAAVSSCLLYRVEPKEDWRGAYRYLASQPVANRLVFFVANEGQLPFAYYLRREPSTIRNSDLTGLPSGFFDVDPPQNVRRVLHDADLQPLRTAINSGRWREVDLVLAHDWFSDPGGRAKSYLDQTCQLLARRDLHQIIVLRYVPPPPP